MAILRRSRYDGSYIPEGIYQAVILYVYIDSAVKVGDNLSDQIVIVYQAAVGQFLRTVRERYFLPYRENCRLASVLQSFLGYVPDQFDSDNLIDMDCYIRIHHKELASGQTWCYVDEVFPMVDES
ncbi:hypothetical protein MKZ07_23165 [Paenibacillus sp. FSL P4-0338]|uniref:hypothetical protein n=1 Tax=Paenibacillus sp. FSL P4-0338 TaxID=2921635 RepID=UPI0030FA38A3